MIYAVLAVLGLILGSFVNALVWRLHEQAEQRAKKRPNKKYLHELSISKGRSMCPHCKHQLATTDLIPVLSWLWLRGKCRYCSARIPDSPLVELATAALFMLSFAAWPHALHGAQVAIFALWLAILVGLMALLAYDVRWYLLPDRITYSLIGLGLVLALTRIVADPRPLRALVSTLLAVLVAGGIFFVLFQVSKGGWIGGGDVKLGWLLGLILGTPGLAFLMIFAASVLGTLVALPLLAARRLNTKSLLPFGPFLIVGTIFALLYGQSVLEWYQRTFLSL